VSQEIKAANNASLISTSSSKLTISCDITAVKKNQSNSQYKTSGSGPLIIAPFLLYQTAVMPAVPILHIFCLFFLKNLLSSE